MYTCLGGWKETEDNNDDVISIPGLEPSDPKKVVPRFAPSTQFMIVAAGSHRRKLCLKLTSTRDNDRNGYLNL